MLTEKSHSKEIIQRTPWLAARFHQIRYDANNHGIAKERLDNFSYLRLFEEMAEKFALYHEARQRHKSPSGYKSLTKEDIGKLKEFGIDGFRLVIAIAKTVAGIEEKESISVSREESRGGLYRYTSLAPFIEQLELNRQPTDTDRQALCIYVSVLEQTLPMYPRLSPPKNIMG